jgi:arylsulfatase A-like enzyme
MRARPFLCAALASLGGACGDAERPRNLLIVCVDTLRADELGAYGQEPSRTPALDRLAAESFVFERAHAAASWTLPSVGALFTALPPSSTNLWTFQSRLADGFTTLAERFHAAGFATHGIASHIYFDGDYGLQQGFDSFDDELCHTPDEPGWQQVTAPAVSQKAASWLAARAASGAREPWLLFVHFFDPHVPYVDHEAVPGGAPPGERESYRSEIAFADRHVGAVLAALEQSGFAGDTNVLFFSDHGESFLEHPGIRRHSFSLYEEELHVPLFLRVPGRSPRRVADFVRTVDLLPTLLELHGLAPAGADECEGASLVPMLDPPLEGAPRAEPVQLAEIRLKDGYHANALLRGPKKLIEDVSNRRLALYDLAADPREQHDLAAREPALVQELEQELRARVRAAEERGVRLGEAGSVESTPAELEHLKKLGYSGQDDEEEPEKSATPKATKGE